MRFDRARRAQAAAPAGLSGARPGRRQHRLSGTINGSTKRKYPYGQGIWHVADGVVASRRWATGYGSGEDHHAGPEGLDRREGGNDSGRRDPEVGPGRKGETRSEAPVDEGRRGHPPRSNRVHERGHRVRCSRAERPPREQLPGRCLPGGGRADPRRGLLSALQLPG